MRSIAFCEGVAVWQSPWMQQLLDEHPGHRLSLICETYEDFCQHFTDVAEA